MLGVVVAALVAAHNTGEGAARFDVDKDGRVDVRIDLVEPDLKDLCDVDFAVVDPEKKRLADEQLDVCVSNGLAQWLRLRVDGHDCKVGGGRARHGDALAVVVEGEAACVAGGDSLTIDWGLFAGTPLDHRATTTIALPDGTEHRAMLSKRKNKLVIALHAPLDVRVFFAVAAVVFVVVASVVVVVVRRRKRR